VFLCDRDAGQIAGVASIFLPAYNQLISRPVLFNGINSDILSIFIIILAFFCRRSATLSKTATINQTINGSEGGGDLSVKTGRDRLFSPGKSFQQEDIILSGGYPGQIRAKNTPARSGFSDLL
jgi:hypothetical protein